MFFEDELMTLAPGLTNLGSIGTIEFPITKLHSPVHLNCFDWPCMNCGLAKAAFTLVRFTQ